jgi:hypothetical protein
VSNLAVLPKEVKAQPELHPRSEGIRNGVEYIRRLRVDAERTWPFVARALATVGLIRQTAAVAAAFWEEASESRPACHRHAAEGRWAILEPKLAEELRRGLPLKLAAARVGVPYASVRNRSAADPEMAARLEIARLQGVAKIHGYVVERAATSDNAAKSLLEWSGEPEYTPRLKIQEVDEGEIVRSKAWARLTSRLAGVLCPECRARAAEAVGE